MDIQNILKQFEPYYEGQDKYYHNFKHATWTVEKGIEILDKTNIESPIRKAYVYAMACHDAGHRNGFQVNDAYNVTIALSIFRRHTKQLTIIERAMSLFIIASTCTPYQPIGDLIRGIKNGDYIYTDGVPYVNTAGVNMFELWEAAEIARDVDQLGIIGIEDDSQREIALIGFMREILRTRTKQDVLSSYKKLTNDSFDYLKCSVSTPYAKQWVKENLEELRRWQLDFTPKALERV